MAPYLKENINEKAVNAEPKVNCMCRMETIKIKVEGQVSFDVLTQKVSLVKGKMILGAVFWVEEDKR